MDTLNILTCITGIQSVLIVYLIVEKYLMKVKINVNINNIENCENEAKSNTDTVNLSILTLRDNFMIVYESLTGNKPMTGREIF